MAVVAVGLAAWWAPAASATVASPLAFGGAPRVDARGLVSLSCAAANLCAGIDLSGRVVTSTRPTDTSGVWRTETILGSAGPVHLLQIACPSTHLCVAIDDSNQVASSIDPTASVPAWRVTSVEAFDPALDSDRNLSSIACPTSSLCVITDQKGDVVTSADPAGAVWTVSQIDHGTTYECVHYGGTQGGCQPGLESVSCPSRTRCIALDESGNELSSTDPTGGANAWQPIGGFNINPGDTFWGSLTCAASRCLTAQNYDGGIYAQSLTQLPPPLPAFTVGGSVTALACPSASLCLAGGAEGTGPAHLYVSTRPQTAAWRSVYSASPGPTGVDITAISCPSTSLCFAADSVGRVTVGTPSPTAAQLTTALHALITPGGRLATIRNILDQRGYRAAITAPLTGKLMITWRRPLTNRAHTSGRAVATVLASAAAGLIKGQRTTVVVRLTAAGRRLLSHAAARLSLIAHAQLIPTSQPGISVSNRIDLRRQ